MAESEDVARLMKALEESEARVLAERRGREEAEARSLDDRRGREEAEARSLDDRRRREEAEARSLDDRRRREEAEARALEAEARTLAERKLRQEMEKKVTPTDYHTFLSMCHDSLYTNMVIQEDLSLAATATFTNADNKYYPLCLKPWTEFSALHKQCQDKLSSLFADKTVFPTIVSFDAIADLMPNDLPLADEEDVRQLQFIRVECCVRRILVQYLEETKAAPSSTGKDKDKAKASASLPMRVQFVNKPHGVLLDGPDDRDGDQQGDSDARPAYKPVMLEALRKDAEARGRATGDGPQPAKRRSSPVRKFHPDQWLMRVNQDGSTVPVFVVEYKAAHKLRGSAIKLAFSNTAREPYGLFAAAIREHWQTKVVQGNERLKSQLDAEKAVARVIAQAFHYMVEFGLSYSYVTSAEALILLYLDAADARTLYYHVALPREDVGSGAAAGDDVQRSAVPLVITLSLLALDAPVLSQGWKKKAVRTLRSWPVPYDEMHIVVDSSEEEDARKLKDVPRLAPHQSQQSCRDATPQIRRRKDGDDDEEEDTDGNGDSSDGVFRPPRSQQESSVAGRSYETRSRKKSTADTNDATDTTDATDATTTSSSIHPCPVLPYCSQACVLGLRNGSRLDRSCPNVQLHPRTESGCHRLTAAQFCCQLREQLACDLDQDCEALDKFKKCGAIGMLFRLTLRDHGYCVVAKGVQRVHAPRLEHELAVYEHLREQQGTLVPVCLGILELVDVYRTLFGAHISHMLVMSYAGEIIGSREAGPMPDDIGKQQYEAWFRLRELGVRHGDEREPNILWDAAQQRVLCIDFEGSKIVDQAKRDQQRKRKHADEAWSPRQSPGQSVPARVNNGTPTKRLVL